MPNFLNEVLEIQDELINLRKKIHANPELGNKEFLTADLIEKYLNDLSIETRRISETGVLGILKAKGNKVIAYRADIDALPIKEETDVDFTSNNKDVMHACGHDVHTAALLGAAKLLSNHKDELNGEVRFIFQMDEEGNGGALRFIEARALDNVDAVFGVHVDPNLPSGKVGIKYDKFYAASDMFDVEIIGKSAHGANCQEGNDALSCACEIILNLKKIEEKIDDPSVIHVGSINSGTARNIVSSTAKFSGIIRTLGSESRSFVKEEIKKVINTVCLKYGCENKLNMIESYGGIVNTNKEVDFLKDTLTKLLGEDEIVIFDKPLMTTEDFGYYIEKTKGAFFHVGAGSNYPLHSCHFLPDDNCLIKACVCASEIIFKYLGE